MPQAIEKRLGELITSNGRPRGSYKDLLERADALKEKLEGLRERRQELSRALDDLEGAQETLARLSAGDRDQVAHKELAEARNRHRQLAELEAHIEAVASDLELKKRNLEQAERAQTERTRLKETITSECETVEQACQRVDEVRQQEKEARSQLGKLRAGVRETRICELEDRCKKAQAAETRLHEAQQGAAAILATDGVIEGIRSAAKELEIIESRLSAAATRIIFDMVPVGLSGIEVDGQLVTVEQPSVQAVEPTTIVIPDRGRIIIEPAIKDRDKLLGQQWKAKVRLKDALQAGGAKTVNDAEDQYTRRQKLMQNAELARQETELHAPATADHDTGAQALSDYIEGLRQILTREMTELSIEEVPTQQEASAALWATQEQAAEARGAVDTARAALRGPEDTLGELQTELGTVSTRHDDGKERLEKLRQQFAGAEEAHADDELQAAIETAQTEVSDQESTITNLQAQRTDETLPQLEARIARLEKAIQDRRDKRGNLKEKIAGLRSHVEALEGAGLDEAIQQKACKLELRDEECRRSEREVRVLSLLLSTTYQLNKENPSTKYQFVDDVRVYEFIEDLHKLPRNNPIATFDTSADILEYLRAQWAGLFQRFLQEQQRISELEILDGMKSVADTLKQLVNFLTKERRSKDDAIKSILLVSHPVFRRLAQITNTPYRVFFTNQEELNKWLKVRGWIPRDLVWQCTTLVDLTPVERGDSSGRAREGQT